MFKLLLLFTLCFLLAGCARPVTNSNANEPQPPRIESADVVKATPEELTLARGESGYATVRLHIKDGYHVNANPPSFSYLKATELEVTSADGISVDSLTYPDPLTKKFSFSAAPLAVYEGEVIVKARLKADQATETRRHNLSARLRVQACDDQVCYAPGVINLQLPVNIK